ncbi:MULTISPECIES: M23 family metallopeptidase, partial [Spirulina sp. CCY15215]|uniref:M23 family metallopeptidase n=1 Tax=Spirulina sp. CCY15215 TaxID=2767591 RepID=UPI00194F948D
RITVNDHVGLPTSDRDAYTFTTDSVGRLLQFAIRNENGEADAKLDGDVKVVLYDNQNNVLKVNNQGVKKDIVTSSNNDPSGTYSFVGLAPNSTYKIRVEPATGEKTNYQLVLNLEEEIATGNYYPNIDNALTTYFSNKAGWQGKSIETMWDRIGGSSAQYGQYARYTGGDIWTKTMPSEVLSIYQDISKAVLGYASSVNAGYAYDEGYEPTYGAHSGIDIDTDPNKVVKSATKGKVVRVENHMPNGYWIAVDELNDNNERTGRRWWYGHLNGAYVQPGDEVNGATPIGLTGDGQAPRHHLHLAVVNSYNASYGWNEIINGKVGNYNSNVENVLGRTVSPLHAYWKYRNGIKE